MMMTTTLLLMMLTKTLTMSYDKDMCDDGCGGDDNTVVDDAEDDTLKES